MNPTTTLSTDRRIPERRASGQLSVENLIAQTHQILRNANVIMSPSKVSRLVRGYKHRVEANGYPFIEYLTNQIVLSEMQRRVVSDELRRVVCYSDPTGETAVANVLAEAMS